MSYLLKLRKKLIGTHGTPPQLLKLHSVRKNEQFIRPMIKLLIELENVPDLKIVTSEMIPENLDEFVFFEPDRDRALQRPPPVRYDKVFTQTNHSKTQKNLFMKERLPYFLKFLLLFRFTNLQHIKRKNRKDFTSLTKRRGLWGQNSFISS
jgi:hypothetical protein